MLSDLWNRIVAWTGTIIAPDWGALVALIPILLLLVVLAFLVITARKWAGAGPGRSGAGPKTPVGPDGMALRGPSAGPFVVAVGAFVLAFGLVAGGLWLPAGIAIALVGLAWLTIDYRRETRPSKPKPTTASAAASPTGPRRSPVTASRAALAGVVVIAIIAIAATSKVVPETPAASIPPVPSEAFEPTLPPADAVLEAYNVTFTQQALTVPAGKPFTVAFDNRDKVPHNLEIRDAAGRSLFMGDIITGPKIVVYAVPALPAGQYPFVCTVHPGMTGTLTAK